MAGWQVGCFVEIGEFWKILTCEGLRFGRRVSPPLGAGGCAGFEKAQFLKEAAVSSHEASAALRGHPVFPPGKLAYAGAVARWFSRVAGPPVPPDLKEQIWHEQAQDFANLSVAIAIIGLASSSTLLLDFAGGPGGQWRNLIGAAIALSYMLIIHNGHNWLAARRTGMQAARSIKVINGLFVGLGVFWGALICLLMAIADQEQRCLLYAVAAGCLATPILFSPASCAFAYWVPFSLGSVVALWVSPVHDPFTVTCLLSFIALSGFCITYINKRLNERAVGALRLAENSEVIKLLLRDFQESASDWLWETNQALQLQHVSKRLSQVSGRTQHELAGVFPFCFLGEAPGTAYPPGSPVGTLISSIASRVAFRDLVIPVPVAGETRYWALTGKPVFDKYGEFGGYHGVGSDITTERRAAEQIGFLARHDQLTKLPNRLLFTETLTQWCDHAGCRPFAVFYIDLDDFKTINERLGHGVGDAVLTGVADRLRAGLAEGDFVARLGGDEFVLLRHCENAAGIASLATTLLESLAQPYTVDGQNPGLTASIGIVLAPQDGRHPNQLLVHADLAMYRAKADGKARLCFYDNDMDARMQDRRQLRADLRQALAAGEFLVEYQPVINLADAAMVGAEALIRWQHPVRGLLQPGEFISLVEESGLIGPVGEFVLRQACRQAASWPAHISIAVNLSPLQFRDAGLVAMIGAALADAGLAPQRLELEITETTMLETDSQTMDALWQLHGKGVRIALDDFGTGYSSLSYLRRFPFDKVKIDRSFIHDLGAESDDSSIILAIIGLAERMNMTVTAEGVETCAQMRLLRMYNCPQVQGFLFSRPVPADDFAVLIALDNRDFGCDGE